jgi:hypothetical protein
MDRDIHTLAETLHALLPSTTMGLAPWEPERQYAVAAQLEAACRAAGVLEEDAVVIAEALAGYLGHWSDRYGNLDDQVDRAQQTLTLALSNMTDGTVHTMREGQEVTPQAIAQMVGWVLLIDMPDEAPGAAEEGSV